MTNPFAEFFAKHAEALEAYNAKAEARTAENADSVTAYIDEALAIDDGTDLDDEDDYDFDPVQEDDEPAPRFTP
nr:hypothetical protein [Brucella anthropi]